MSIRTERVGSLIKEEIGAILIRDYNDPAFGLTTVTDVKVSGDLRIAKVYFSVLGSAELQARTMEMLEAERAHIRGIVGHHMRMRFIPELHFYHDTTLDRVDRINALLKEIHRSEGEHEGGGEK